jgi:predicted DNA-binding ribbon-helix-helix protein
MPQLGRKAEPSITKRSLKIAGRKTSISLEEAFWKDLREIAAARHVTLIELIGEIDAERQRVNLSSAIRIFVLQFYRDEISRREQRQRTIEILDTGPIAPK